MSDIVSKSPVTDSGAKANTPQTPTGGGTDKKTGDSADHGVASKLDQDERRRTLPTFESKSNFFTWVFVSFLDPIFKIGTKRSLKEDDLGVSLPSDDPRLLYDKFEKKWKGKPDAKFSSSLYSASGTSKWVFAVFLNAIVSICQFMPTYIMRDLLRDINSTIPYLTNGKRWWWTAGLFVFPALAAVLSSWSNMILVRVGVHMKSMSSEAVYRKALRLSSSAKGETSTGQIVTIMSSDTSMIQMFVMIVSVLVNIPITLYLSLRMVSEQMGGSLTWIAFAMYVAMMLIQFSCTSFVRKTRMKMIVQTDFRTKVINEVLNGIRVIKYYCWEKPFKGKIIEAREKELKFVTLNSWLMSLSIDVLLIVVPQLVPVVCFSLYERVMHQPLNSTVAFTSISSFGMLVVPFLMLPMALMVTLNYFVSMNRIKHLLSLDEVDSRLVIRDAKSGQSIDYVTKDGQNAVLHDFDESKDAVIIKDGSFAWGNGENVLNNVNVRIPKGKLVAVVGKVGSGKTTFVSTMLGELTRKTGVVIVNGTMAYSAQQPWLINDTVRNNILFGKPYDKSKYDEVIDNACLRDDMNVLVGGDQCEIGERGINVSGGQKARVSMARCAYSDSDIMVFDDPIAAVDSHVGKAMFNQLIRKSLDGKTRILVTNATQYLHKCDYIIIIDKNEIHAQGTYQELKDQNIDFMALLTEEDMSSAVGGKTSSSNKKLLSDKSKTPSSRTNEKPKNPEVKVTTEGTTGGPVVPTDGSLVDAESKQTGRVSMKVYGRYIKAAGVCLCISILMFYFFATVSNVSSQFWMTNWSDDSRIGSHTTQYWINGYIIFNMCVVVFQVSRACSFVPAKIHASRKLHNDLTVAVLDAPVAFHDVTPVGRVLNRFSKDIESLDFQLPMQFNQLFGQVFSLLGSVVNMCYTTNGIILLILIPAGITFYYVQDRFRRSNTDIQRVESLTRSPIFTDFQSVLNGTPSIRAFAHQDRFIKGMEHKLDRNNHALIIFNYASSWLQVRSDFISSVIVVSVGILSTLMCQFKREWVTGGKFGLALSSALQMSTLLKQLVRFMAQLEAQMNSVERITDYIENVKPEPPMITDKRPPPGWPNAGRIEMKNAKLRYRDGPLVLKGVTANIESKEKIGIVGRTGAGKSSMMIALFRITDLCDGSISIDGVNLADIGLEDVRRALCIIPQDPVLFSETVRFNIDPFNEYSDEDIWSVLQLVELSDTVKALPHGLSELVHEGGSNFSVGERQLICMARALLRKPKVLILDEATASLDNETDAYLQMMLRKSFKECTTLTIAHRLNTIMDSTKVMVMDKGVVAEFDTPFNLLQNRTGIFSGMVEATNDESLYDLVPGCEHLKKPTAIAKKVVDDGEYSPMTPIVIPMVEAKEELKGGVDDVVVVNRVPNDSSSSSSSGPSSDGEGGDGDDGSSMDGDMKEFGDGTVGM